MKRNPESRASERPSYTGFLGESTFGLLRMVGSSIASAKDNLRERTWLTQRILVAVVRGNAISIVMSCRRAFPYPERLLFCDSV